MAARKPTAILAAGLCCAIGLAACGSPATKSGTLPGGSDTSGAASGSAGSNPATTLHVSGAFTAVAQEQQSQAQCTKSSFSTGTVGSIQLFYDTNGQSGPSNIYELVISYVPTGTTTTFPIANPPQGAGPWLRLSYRDNSDYLDWGYNSSPPPNQQPGAPAQGTVTMTTDAESGSFDLQLPFTGDDNHTLAAGSRPTAHVTGGWACDAP